MSTMLQSPAAGYQLRFRSLFHPGRCYAFPCDSGGRVDLDTLGEKLRNSYFFVRTVVGRDVASPEVCRAESQAG